MSIYIDTMASSYGNVDPALFIRTEVSHKVYPTLPVAAADGVP
jgi:hypothetical protein